MFLCSVHAGEGHSHTDGLSQAVQVCAVAVDAVVHVRGQAGVSGGAVAPVIG